MLPVPKCVRGEGSEGNLKLVESQEKDFSLPPASTTQCGTLHHYWRNADCSQLFPSTYPWGCFLFPKAPCGFRNLPCWGRQWGQPQGTAAFRLFSVLYRYQSQLRAAFDADYSHRVGVWVIDSKEKLPLDFMVVGSSASKTWTGILETYQAIWGLWQLDLGDLVGAVRSSAVALMHSSPCQKFLPQRGAVCQLFCRSHSQHFSPCRVGTNVQRTIAVWWVNKE